MQASDLQGCLSNRDQSDSEGDWLLGNISLDFEW
jgi:hypothetical protein